MNDIPLKCVKKATVDTYSGFKPPSYKLGVSGLILTFQRSRISDLFVFVEDHSFLHENKADVDVARKITKKPFYPV